MCSLQNPDSEITQVNYKEKRGMEEETIGEKVLEGRNIFENKED